MILDEAVYTYLTSGVVPGIGNRVVPYPAPEKTETPFITWDENGHSRVGSHQGFGHLAKTTLAFVVTADTAFAAAQLQHLLVTLLDKFVGHWGTVEIQHCKAWRGGSDFDKDTNQWSRTVYAAPTYVED